MFETQKHGPSRKYVTKPHANKAEVPSLYARRRFAKLFEKRKEYINLRCFSLHQDTHEHSREHTGVLGIFDPTGHGSCCYQQTGKLRYINSQRIESWACHET